MRLYRLVTKAGTDLWVVTPALADARAYAVRHGGLCHDDIDSISDETDTQCSTRGMASNCADILRFGRTGFARLNYAGIPRWHLVS